MIDHNKHEFSLYWPSLSPFESLRSGSTITIDDTELCHRISRVLRLTPDETLIVFDQQNHMRLRLIQIPEKKPITATIVSYAKNHLLKPWITFLLPILKREALHEAVYSLAEIGANEIKLMVTDKVQRSWHDQELHRLENIIIAAAEQSKNFSFPSLYAPQRFEKIVSSLSARSIFFDPQGAALASVIDQVKQTCPETITLIIGPEGDLTSAEKEVLHTSGTQFCSLTPTIVRAQQAAALSIGIIRSFFK